MGPKYVRPFHNRAHFGLDDFSPPLGIVDVSRVSPPPLPAPQLTPPSLPCHRYQQVDRVKYGDGNDFSLQMERLWAPSQPMPCATPRRHSTGCNWMIIALSKKWVNDGTGIIGGQVTALTASHNGRTTVGSGGQTPLLTYLEDYHPPHRGHVIPRTMDRFKRRSGFIRVSYCLLFCCHAAPCPHTAPPRPAPGCVLLEMCAPPIKSCRNVCPLHLGYVCYLEITCPQERPAPPCHCIVDEQIHSPHACPAISPLCS